MKKVLIAALIAGFSLSATAAQTIRFATEASYPPFESMDANNKIVGFDVDLANALCKENRRLLYLYQSGVRQPDPQPEIPPLRRCNGGNGYHAGT
ncbi:arginine ABC transporter ATP-binding protein [Salmonella enterica subsp. enterica]|nr:arginine ABC transporter ATP-binding protein [Salmonella enterica subsp. enterica]